MTDFRLFRRRRSPNADRRPRRADVLAGQRGGVRAYAGLCRSGGGRLDRLRGPGEAARPTSRPAPNTGYGLLWVVLLANVDRDAVPGACPRSSASSPARIAEMCRDHFSRPVVARRWCWRSVAVLIAQDMGIRSRDRASRNPGMASMEIPDCGSAIRATCSAAGTLAAARLTWVFRFSAADSPVFGSTTTSKENALALPQLAEAGVFLWRRRTNTVLTTTLGLDELISLLRSNHLHGTVVHGSLLIDMPM